MRLRIMTIVTAAFAFVLLSAFTLRAEQPTKASAGDGKGADATSATVADPRVPLPEAPATATLVDADAAMPYAANTNDPGMPRAEIFLGYSYLRAVPTLATGNRLVWLNGGSTSIAFNFNHYLGLVGDFGGFNDTELRLGGNPTTVPDSSGNVFTYLAGPRLSNGNHRIVPFAQVLFGGVHASAVTLSSCSANCALLPSETKFAMTAGGGLDIVIHRHFAIRIIQAEYLMTRFENPTSGSAAGQNDVRLSSGIVFRFGGGSRPAGVPAPGLTYSCSVNPSSAFPGGSIAVSGTAEGLNLAKTPVYTWSADGGTVTGTTGTATINTTNAAPGTYTLKGHISEGDKPSENADCTAAYVVKPFEAPTVTCSANPASVPPGENSTITATGLSPQNRPLTYSYTSTAGTISGSGSTASLSISSGTATVTCNVADDKGQTASATTSVEVTVLAVPPVPVVAAMCSISFGRDSRRPSRVDNEAKACLDDVALNLQRNADARLAMIGNGGNSEVGGKKLSANRATNAKAYLVSEKGIDASRIAFYTGSQDGKTVVIVLIPVGATFDSTGDTPVQ
jgi:hypothetical protein